MSASEYSLDRGLPANISAEQSLLGVILLDGELFDISGILVEDFFMDSHRRIYRRMVEMSEAKQPIDIVTISEVLSHHGELESVGGAAYLSSLTDGTPRRTSVAHYVRLVREKSALRELVRLGNTILTQALDPSETAAGIIQAGQNSLMQMALVQGASDGEMFVDVADFCAGADTPIDWIVEGLIERGSNGIMAGDPKAGKSVAAVNLAVCLALGTPWMGLSVRQRVRTAIVSREDNPDTTKRRFRQIARGKGADMEELRGWCHVNSKAQTPSFMLDNPREVANLIHCIKRWGSEFVILDVFNKMHSQDENKNTETRMVMNQVDRMAAETHAMFYVLHHFNKNEGENSITRRIRGAGAIAGFAESIVGIDVVDEKDKVRQMRFETKVGEPLAPIHYQIVESDYGKAMTFKLVTTEQSQ